MNYDIVHSEWDSFRDDGNEYDLIYLDPPFFTQKSEKSLKSAL